MLTLSLRVSIFDTNQLGLFWNSLSSLSLPHLSAQNVKSWHSQKKNPNRSWHSIFQRTLPMREKENPSLQAEKYSEEKRKRKEKNIGKAAHDYFCSMFCCTGRCDCVCKKIQRILDVQLRFFTVNSILRIMCKIKGQNIDAKYLTRYNICNLQKRCKMR